MEGKISSRRGIEMEKLKAEALRGVRLLPKLLIALKRRICIATVMLVERSQSPAKNQGVEPTPTPTSMTKNQPRESTSRKE
jgi:hypothetical protein